MLAPSVLDGPALLQHGPHATRAAGLCVTEAVAWAAGESHTDRPLCLCPVLAAWARAWNDRLPDDATRTRLLAPLIGPLVRSQVCAPAAEQRAALAFEWLIHTYAPAWLALRPTLRRRAAALRGMRTAGAGGDLARVQRALVGIRERASADWDRVWLDAWRTAADSRTIAGRRAGAVWRAAWAAAWAAAWDAGSLAGWDAARAAADRPAWADARALAWHSAWAAARASVLSVAWRAAAASSPGEEYAAAHAAASAILSEVVGTLQESAVELGMRMTEVGERAAHAAATSSRRVWWLFQR